VITKYVADGGYGLVIDASTPWPQGPVVLAAPSMDITKNIVDAYNAQSGVPAPVRSGSTTGAAKPAGTTPGAAKPATTPAKPATTTAPPKQ
jgi:outer membrane protein